MAGSLFVLPRQTPVNGSGRPYPGATLTFYAAGTSTLATVYTDSALSIAAQNPITADSSGQFRPIYSDQTLKAVLKDASGATIWIEDNIPPGGSGSGGSSGDPGPTGDPGLSVAELAIYKRAATTPATPSGGSYNFATQSLTAPDGWSSDIPAGYDPVWTSRAVAAVEGATGTDSVLTWNNPVQVFSDGQSVDIIFKRNAGQPATPAPSPGVPAGWYTDVDSVPASENTLWSSVGTRANAGENWVWQLPVQVEGDQGPAGPSSILYYIKPTAGTAIKNGTGTLTVEARKLEGGTDTLLSSGTIKLYVGTTEVTTANGYATGSTGYIGKFDSGDISGAVTVTLKDGPSGTALDTITLVDVADGTADTGKNAVFGFVEPSNGLAWVRASDGTTWSPSATTTRLDCTFVQGGADVARVAWTITRDASGLLTGAAGTHGSGDLNGSRVTVTEVNEGTQVFTVKFAYSFGGDTALVAETVYTSLSGSNGSTGPTGPSGPGALTLALTKRHIPLQAYTNGSVVSYAAANGQATVYSGTTDVTASATINAAVASNCAGTINTALNTPVTGAKGYYQITSLSGDTGTLTLSATYGGNTVTEVVTVSRVNVGYEIVASLPVTNLFQGRVVFLTTDNKLYRYTGSAWVREVDGADIKANSITTNSISAGAITAAKIAVTSLSSLTANLGTVTAGVAKAGSDQLTIDFNNAWIVFDTAPGQAGIGYVRLMGYGFGNSYIDWYGPKPAGASTISQIIAGLTDANALSFQKTDGTYASAGRIRGEFEVKSWGKWREDQSTGAITMLDRFNVASMASLGSTGLLQVTFSTALPNTNYAVCITANNGDTSSTRPLICGAYNYQTTGFKIRSIGDGGNSNNAEAGSFIVFGSNVVGGSNVSTPSGGGYTGGAISRGNVP